MVYRIDNNLPRPVAFPSFEGIETPPPPKVTALVNTREYTQDSINVSPLMRVARVLGLYGIFRSDSTLAVAEDPSASTKGFAPPVPPIDRPRITLPRKEGASAPPPTELDGIALENLIRQTLVAQDHLGASYLSFANDLIKLHVQQNKELWNFILEKRKEAEKYSDMNEAFKWISIGATIIGTLCAVAALCLVFGPAGAGVIPSALYVGLTTMSGVGGITAGGFKIAEVVTGAEYKKFNAAAQKGRYLHEMNDKEIELLVQILSEISAESQEQMERRRHLEESHNHIINRLARGEE